MKNQIYMAFFLLPSIRWLVSRRERYSEEAEDKRTESPLDVTLLARWQLYHSSVSNVKPNCEADSLTLLTIGELSVRGLVELLLAVNFTSIFR